VGTVFCSQILPGIESRLLTSGTIKRFETLRALFCFHIRQSQGTLSTHEAIILDVCSVSLQRLRYMDRDPRHSSEIRRITCRFTDYQAYNCLCKWEAWVNVKSTLGLG